MRIIRMGDKQIQNDGQAYTDTQETIIELAIIAI